MSALLGFFRLTSSRQGANSIRNTLGCLGHHFRSFADTRDTDVTKTQGTEGEERVRVRRARPADVPRVLRYVREHARVAWPGPVAPPSASHLVLCDYVARALAQGHSMLAEQHETRNGWSQIQGLALGMAICPWDATVLEKWARCVKCSRSRRLMHFTAHCLRAPALHDKYRVHNILQIILIVPPDTPKSAEIVQMLAKNAIQRGRDVGFPVLRFDVTDNKVAKSLEEIKLKKEWQLSYDVLPDSIKDYIGSAALNAVSSTVVDAKVETTNKEDSKKPQKENFISVYSAFTLQEKRD
ncbi:hypothetical protein K1T71_004807 [Dendrolimus kikuchii]|uniref:Uncharacterized protein n=1 Tax=Dendrolimus kikuchii TaxID=765133 RepID=A0ACC1D5L5_9NEOP|nr:hypothetical protein K1T71_004807 [Dendrolimus kikuchii]